MPASLNETLALVAQRGAPAQQAEALRLISALAVTPDDAEELQAARQLVDAYLHDPYLDKG